MVPSTPQSTTRTPRMSCCCGPLWPSVVLLRIPGGTRLNNATLESGPAQQRDTRGGRAPNVALLRSPSGECDVVADSKGVPDSTTQHSRPDRLNNATLAAARAPNVALLRSPGGECDVVADSRGSQTQQRNTRIQTGSTTQHSRQCAARRLIVALAPATQHHDTADAHTQNTPRAHVAAAARPESRLGCSHGSRIRSDPAGHPVS